MTDDVHDGSEDVQNAAVPRFLDIHAIVLKSNSKKRKMFEALKDVKQKAN